MSSDQRGVLYLEALVALLPVLLLFAAALFFCDLAACVLIVERAANVAARASVVVLPDDPVYYHNQPANEFKGERQAQIVAATRAVLHAASALDAGNAEVSVLGSDRPKTTFKDFDPLTARVAVEYRCGDALIAFACGSDRRLQLRAEATLSYQGAEFDYIEYSK